MKIATVISTFLVALLYAGRSLLGPARCRYAIGCTEFAADQLHNKPMLTALLAIFCRLMSCNPISRPIGYIFRLLPRYKIALQFHSGRTGKKII